jgi:hypothetical protein
MRSKALLFLTTLLAPSIAASAETRVPAEPTYSVSVSLRDGDRVVAEPQLTVRANHSAEIAVSDKDGGRYDMRFTISPQGEGTVVFRSSLAIATASGARHEAEPTLLVGLDGSGAIEFQDSAMERPLRASIQIRPVATPAS